MKPMKHDDAPHTPDRRLAKRYNIDMPHGVPTTSAKGSAQVRIVRATRALNMKPLGVVGDPLALLRDLRGADPSSPMDQTSSIGKTFDAIHDRSFSPASVVDFEASTVTSTVTFFGNDDQAPTRPGPQSGSTYKANITGTSPPLPPTTPPPPTKGSAPQLSPSLTMMTKLLHAPDRKVVLLTRQILPGRARLFPQPHHHPPPRAQL